MAKYYRFHYSAGYVGTDETAVYYTESQIIPNTSKKASNSGIS